MSSTQRKTFRCVVIAPAGKLLDGETSSVVFPAHDGQIGVQYNHIPMLCNLGLGIMEVKSVPWDTEALAHSSFLLIDGGLGLVGQNLLTIIASDAIYLHGMKGEQVETMLENAKKKLAAGTYTPDHRTHELRKISFLTQLMHKSENVMK